MRLVVLLLTLLALYSCSDTTSSVVDNQVDPIDSLDSLDSLPDTTKDTTPDTVIYVGSRSSWYGFSTSYGYESFPTPLQLATVYINMASKVEHGVPSAIWIITGVNIDSNDPFENGTCHIEFPNPLDTTPDYMTFWGGDRHEEYLDMFDAIGAKIFLQVEPGLANVPQLIDLTLERYGNHPSVVGFGVDVEWYPSDGETNATTLGKKSRLTNEEVALWDAQIKEFNSEYRLFVKHWEPEFTGDSAVSDVIYINDSQNRGSIDTLVADYQKWANHFYPNDVGFQFGYPNDEEWWQLYEDPFTTIIDRVQRDIPNQKSHFFWVDFTLNHSAMNSYWQ